ncbi:MAG: sulfur oxidation c-type cytochrome SoxX [Rhodocyclales bacterium RIFCSPLOWO2_02_FULL_63_24]|nr:MAG: sulfur oxidation c-type cytochrome SoxX [Rhodocyclales bacterium RIFCSPLOWO2_02_FULL_63_24]
MKTEKQPTLSVALAIGVATALMAGCATDRSAYNPSPEVIKHAMAAFKRDFDAKGAAGLDRLNTDKLQDVCNATNSKPSPDMAAVVEREQEAAIKLPADGKFLGDWKAGEKLAQSGRGMTWKDKAGIPNGGNCYNCHQISPAELSYGTIGPSLLHFGKTRGNSPEIQKYAYSKIYNSKAFSACSAMPRFGHAGALTETQIKDLVALLLDPTSPVNK